MNRNNTNQASAPEQIDKGGVKIARTPFDYTVTDGNDDLLGKYTRLHNVLELIHEPKIYMGKLKNVHAERVTELNIIDRPFQFDHDIPLARRTVGWSADITAIGAGMMLNDILCRLGELDATTRSSLNRELSALITEIKNLGADDESEVMKRLQAMVSVMQPATPLEAIKGLAVAKGVVSPKTDREQVIRPFVSDFIEQAAYIDSSYMTVSASNGTAIHNVLEYMANYAMENKTVIWPDDEIQATFGGVLADHLVEKAWLTWDATVKLLDIKPENLFDAELVVLINHNGERIAGAVDLAIIKDDKLIILDWKTGKSIRSEYQAQLVSYSLASTLITRYGALEIDNPEAKALNRADVNNDYELPNEPEATFVHNGRTITLAPFGILVRTAVDASQDEESQEAQFWKVNYDPQLREFAYRMIQFHTQMEEGKINTRLQRGLVRLHSLDVGKSATITEDHTASKLEDERVVEQRAGVAVDEPIQKVSPVEDLDEEPFGPTIAEQQSASVANSERTQASTVTKPVDSSRVTHSNARPDAAKESYKAKQDTPQPENKTQVTPAPAKGGVGSAAKFRLVATYAQRYGWTDAQKAAFEERLAQAEGAVSVSALAASFNQGLQGGGSNGGAAFKVH